MAIDNFIPDIWRADMEVAFGKFEDMSVGIALLPDAQQGAGQLAGFIVREEFDPFFSDFGEEVSFSPPTSPKPLDELFGQLFGVMG